MQSEFFVRYRTSLGMLLGALLLALSQSFASSAAAAPSLQTLYKFCQETDCADGKRPTQRLTMDSAGNLYGTTDEGGSNDNGVAFELVKTDHGYDYQKLYVFCSEADCADGASPEGNLILDVDDNVYGTTAFGGAGKGGTVFKLVPNKHRTKWKLTTVYNFCSLANCVDGNSGTGGLTYRGEQTGAVYDGTSPLYGATISGGSTNSGTVFQLTFAHGKKKAKETPLYSFCEQEQCNDGISLSGGPIIDTAGNLYGLTSSGGRGQGVAYELSANKKQFTFNLLYVFCQVGSCEDGLLPLGRMTMDANGNLLGVTENGGTHAGNGVLFKIVPKKDNSKQTVLYDFCAKGSCVDGSDPNGDLAMDADGNLFGTAFTGGQHFNGAIFEFGNGKEQVLYSFCSVSGCSDGTGPIGSVILDPARNLFGTTAGGGISIGAGTVFELTP